ncbi:phosphoribosyl transferase domain protein [Mycobacterium kansasii]|uniref:Phosphoribosyl transferase domain protein n=1 Tax=Mycobacterium kansasii TaxID=1768 RepID=A0A1V3W8T8_MYCKA|nr:phosphoribosyl transferase domain protein [Mycobacterium kansasii]
MARRRQRRCGAGVADHAAATARHRRARGRELVRREAIYRAGRPPLASGKTVILVDEVGTGASMFAAVQALREAEPDRS